MKISKILKQRIALFCRNSSLHGLKYIGEHHCSTAERAFWLISFLTAVGFAVYFIGNLFDKYNHNPVIVAVNSQSISSRKIPFPTVTICNMNRVSKIEATDILAKGTELEKQYINNLCFSNTSTPEKPDIGEWKTEDLIDFVIKISPTCQEMLKACQWNTDEVDCEDIFSTVLTDIGACCSFNPLPLKYIFKKPMQINETKAKNESMFQDWNFEVGYRDNDKTLFPWPLHGSGLSVILDTDVDNYYCSISNSMGYMLQLSNPNETPKMELYALHISPGLETTVNILPYISDSDDSLRSVPMPKRKCYFNNEKYLRYYRTYTRHNCITDCEANYTTQRCGCLPYYLITKSFIPVCTKEHANCIADVLEIIAMNERPPHDKSQCKCFPPCFLLDYRKHFNYGRLVDTFKVKSNYIKNFSINYFVKNMAVVNLFFPDSTTLRVTKSEIYGDVELMSNIGGLLAIFLGFSFLSATEVIYYLICNMIPAVFNAIYNNIKERRMLFPFTR